MHSSTASKDSKTSSLTSSDDDSLDEGDDLHTITDWHTHLMTLKQRASSCPDPFERIQIISSIKEAVDDFRDFACDIVKVIIDEAYLPVDQKTIKPIGALQNFLKKFLLIIFNFHVQISAVLQAARR